MSKKGKCLLSFGLAFMLTVISVLQVPRVQAADSSADKQITHQPTAKEPYVKLNREGASFSWHKAEPADCLVVSGRNQDDQIEGTSTENTYNDTLRGWEASSGELTLDIPAKDGDLLTLTPCSGFNGTIKGPSGYSFTEETDGTYTCDIARDGSFSFTVSETDNRSFWVRAEITRLMPAGRVAGQNSDTFTGDPGTYICVASFTDGDTINSDPLKVIGYDITASSSGNGNCRIQTGGKDVSTAAPGQKITIKPEPADTYELDSITVTRKDDSSTQVSVNDNSFIMPDCPLTVRVTFRMASYHMTLP